MQGDVKVLLKPVMTTADFALLMTHLNPPNEAKGEKPWSTERARKWLKRRGLLQDYGQGRYCVTQEHLERVLPALTGDVRVMQAREGRS